ncbi:hypothetical protein FGG08_007215 [Glutinoglossum americanum]|uniref:Sulfhydryl oxidase n=1 Tax=Glutinoglossum americanum TaxID=1670608 RepID=A0A9P8HUQ1_9PEZI|nr:hypothetical protein FGG08_007215 [Glutinoglossum americanum]
MMPVQLHRRALAIVAVTLTFIFLLLRSLPSNPENSDTPIHHVDASQSTLHGEVIMPTLGNETQKAELGRAAWKLFHTIMARFPDKPTTDESTALEAYVHLFARLYPWQAHMHTDCLQTSSRSSAAAWACHVHNIVNKSLQKPVFDCSKIGEFYKCGCADEGEGSNDGEEGGVAIAGSSGDSKIAVQRTAKPTEDGGSVRMKLEREG